MSAEGGQRSPAALYAGHERDGSIQGGPYGLVRNDEFRKRLRDWTYGTSAGSDQGVGRVNSHLSLAQLSVGGLYP